MRKLLALLLFSFLLAGLPAPASAQAAQFVVRCEGANDTAAMQAAVTAIGANPGTIRLPYKAGTRCAVNTLTLPTNVTLDNTDGTGIKVNTGQTLTIQGPLSNPPGKKLFYNALAGQGTVSFAGNAVLGQVWAQWWGYGDGTGVDSAAQTAAATAAATATNRVTVGTSADLPQFLDARAYGVVCDGSTNTTTAIQAALDAANAARKGLQLPPGICMTNTLTWPQRIYVRGAGGGLEGGQAEGHGTTLRSRAAEVLIRTLGSLTTQASGGPGTISDLNLDGNSVGTVGLDLYCLDHFVVKRVSFYNFTETGLDSRGSQIGSFEDCYFKFNRTHARVREAVAAGFGGAALPANSVTFVRSWFRNHTKWAVSFEGRGGKLVIRDSDFGLGGTTGDADSGTIKMLNWGGTAGESLGLELVSSWIERQEGFATIYIGEPAGNTVSRTSIISSTLFVNTTLHGVYVAPSTKFHVLNTYGSAIIGHPTADIYLGTANVGAILHGTRIQTQFITPGASFTSVASSTLGYLQQYQDFWDTNAQNVKHEIKAVASGSGSSLHIVKNGTMSSTGVWDRADTSLPSMRLTFSESGDSVALYRCAPGANPCSAGLTPIWQVSSAGNMTVAGTLQVGGGAAVQKFLTGTASLDFTALAANSCESFTVTVTGAAEGDAVSVGVPNALASVAGTSFTGFVSATDTVSVRRCNVSTGATADPAAATVRVSVTKY